MSERSEDFIRGVKHVLDNAFTRYGTIYRPIHKEYTLPDETQNRIDEIEADDKRKAEIEQARKLLEAEGFTVQPSMPMPPEKPYRPDHPAPVTTCVDCGRVHDLATYCPNGCDKT